MTPDEEELARQLEAAKRAADEAERKRREAQGAGKDRAGEDGAGNDQPAAETEKEPAGAGRKGRAEGKAGKARRKRPGRSLFKVEDGQVWRLVEDHAKEGAPSATWVAFGSELHVHARTRNADGEDHGRLLEVVDADGVRHLWAMPAAMLAAAAGEGIKAELLRLGWTPAPTAGRRWRDWLVELILSAEPEERVRCVATTGWHGERFVLPDEVIGAETVGERVLLQSPERMEHALNVKGNLEDWRDGVARFAVGNSRLVLAISAAFAAPLLAVTGDEGGGFHFRGASSTGKSTALTVAGSVWGGGGLRGYVQSWRATENGLEGVAGLHRDGFLALDELSQLDAKAAGAAAYMLSNGAGKARAGREGQARKPHTWRLLFLSNGEIGLADKIAEGGGRIAAGMEVRVIDLRADAGAGLGIFEGLHGAADAAGFAQALKASAGNTYGTAGRAFLRHLVADLAAAREAIGALRRLFVADVVPAGADGQVRRVADRFALVAAAGEAATLAGVTGWPRGVATEAAQRCFRSWLKERGGIGSSEVAEARRRLRQLIEVHGASRFRSWYPDPRRVMVVNAAGYVKAPPEELVEDHPDKVPTYFVHPSAMEELMHGLDRSAVLEELADEGVLVRHDRMRKGKAVSKSYGTFRVPSEGGARKLYQTFLPILMRGPDDDD